MTAALEVAISWDTASDSVRFPSRRIGTENGIRSPGSSIVVVGLTSVAVSRWLPV